MTKLKSIDDILPRLSEVSSFSTGAFYASGNEAFNKISGLLLNIIIELNYSYECKSKNDRNESESILHQGIEDLDFTDGMDNLLLALNIRTIGDLINHSEYDLITLPKLGKKRLSEIKDALKERGLKLKGQ
jgi:DNA-directed RNA polymerase subunit alpha